MRPGRGLCGLVEGLVEQGVEQAPARGVGKPGLQPVAQRHELVDPCDNAALFCEGWEGNW